MLPGTTAKKTFCRLCEVNCGLEATLDSDGRIAKLRPDHDHPVTRGFACHKGLLALEVHHDPDRLETPMRRTKHGFESAAWDEAIDDIATRLRAVLDAHGPQGVGIYMGNPCAFNALGAMSAGMFAATLGIENLFNAGTQDCANKFAVGEILYGSAELHPIADIDRADFLLILGANPRISKTSFLSTADPVGVLRAARKRGASIRFVNPLALADMADIGKTLQIRPDTDAYLLAAILCEIERTSGLDTAATSGMRNLDRVRNFARAYPPERVAEVVGLPAREIVQLAHDLAEAPHAAVHMSTGVNMGQQGALAYWLVQMLSLVTGNLDRAGGNIFSARAVPPMLAGEPTPLRNTKWGDYRPPRGTPPGGLLADMILDDANPIRALFVIAGNPLLSIAGGDRLRGALSGLDLLVSTDFYRNATAELAHWALPAADWFEREDLNYFVQGVQREPYLQWTDSLVEPQGERREDWWILSRIQQALGFPSLFDIPGGDALKALWNGRLEETGHSVDAIRSAPDGIIVLPQAEPGGSLEQIATTMTGKIFDMCPDALLATLERAEPIFESLSGEASGQLKLITRRTHHMLNSSLQNLKRLKTDKGARTNPLYMSPQDASDRDLEAGDFVIVRNDHGQVIAELALDANLRPGVVAMSHGFGNDRTPGMPTAQAFPGVNVNALSPSGAGSFDPVSAMSHLTGIAVEVLGKMSTS